MNVRSYILGLIVLFLFSALPVKAQQAGDFGFKGGINFANYLSGENHQSSRVAFMGGFFLNLSGPTEKLFFQPEIALTQKGAVDSTATIKTNYVQFAVLTKLRLTENRKFSPYALLGPYFAVVMNAEAEAGGITRRIDNAESDLGVVGGLGTNINLPNTSFFVEARYELGITDPYGDATIFGVKANSWRNSVFNIVLGIKI